MQQKLLRQLTEELAGELAGPVVDILYNKKDVNEFLIAKKMEMTINQIRNILYKLSAEGLVSFIRKKDKRKGWYIYYWTLNTEKCLIQLEQSLNRKIEKLQEKLGNRENRRYYFCKTCDIEVGEETALEHGFSCEECFGVYELADNEKPIRMIKLEISRRERELKIITGELGLIREKIKKKRAKVEKKEAKEKAKEKEQKRKARAKERAKKKSGEKKPVKKKSKRAAKKIRKLVKKVKKAVGKKKVVKKKVKKRVAKKKVKKKAGKKKIKKSGNKGKWKK